MNPRASRRRDLALVLLFTCASAAVFLYLFVLAGGRVPVGDRYEVTAVLADGFGLESNAEVRSAGVRIGRVVGIRPEGRRAAVRMQLDGEHSPLYADARVKLRSRTLVGENYIEVRPGGPPARELVSGGRLPLEQADETVQFDQILGTLDPSTRRAVRANLRGLGRGLARRGADVNATFDGLQETAGHGVTVLGAVHARRRDLARVIDNTATVLGALSEREDALRGLVVDAKRTALAAAARDGELRESVRELPATLTAARGAVGSLERLSITGRPAVADLRTAVVALRPALDALAPTARDALALTRRVPALGRQLRPLLTDLRSFSRSSRPAVRDLLPVLRQLEPAVTHLSAHSREVGSVIANVGAFEGAADATGSLARVQLLFDESSLSDALPPQADRAIEALRRAGLVQTAPGTDANPYPRPGTLDRPQPFDGAYPKTGGPDG